jgi:hypothetical protein
VAAHAKTDDGDAVGYKSKQYSLVKDYVKTMKIPLLIFIALIFFILVTGCIQQPSDSGNLVVTTTQVPATPIPIFPDGSKFTTLITVTGQSGKTSDTFSVPQGYWELWYTADPLIMGGQDSVSASGSNSALFPYLSIQVIDKTNSDRVVETVEPPGGLDKILWAKSVMDPRPWKQKFYEGNKDYCFVITTRHLKSYAIEARIPKSSLYTPDI